MKKNIKSQIEITASPESYEEVYEFIVGVLKKNGISKTVENEVMLVFEAIYQEILEQTDESTQIRVSAIYSLGDIRISFGYYGQPFTRTISTSGMPTPEEKILNAYEDKIDSTYHSAYNTINISVRRSSSRAFIYSVLAMILAIIVYLVLHNSVDAETETRILTECVEPFENLLARAMLMIAAPVTFFSLLKNLTDTYIFASVESSTRRVQEQTLITSVISVVLAAATAIAFGIVFKDRITLFREFIIADLNDSTIAEVLDNLIPTDILTIFSTISPFPMILVSLIATYAFCTSGRYFDSMKKATDTCYTLFSSMLTLIMASLPVFAFASFVDLMICEGIAFLLYLLAFMLVVSASMAVLAAFYVIRLRAAGIAVIPFVKTLMGLVPENIEINSAIDAVPFNIRYCMRYFGIKRAELEKSLPILAQINLDGNCFVLMFITASFLMLCGTPFSAANVLMVGVLVLFLSLGAPNQPGSILIGLIILMSYLNVTELLPVAILCEVSFGILLNIVNVIGDMVTVMIEHKREA